MEWEFRVRARLSILSAESVGVACVRAACVGGGGATGRGGMAEPCLAERARGRALAKGKGGGRDAISQANGGDAWPTPLRPAHVACLTHPCLDAPRVMPTRR